MKSIKLNHSDNSALRTFSVHAGGGTRDKTSSILLVFLSSMAIQQSDVREIVYKVDIFELKVMLEESSFNVRKGKGSSSEEHDILSKYHGSLPIRPRDLALTSAQMLVRFIILKERISSNKNH